MSSAAAAAPKPLRPSIGRSRLTSRPSVDRRFAEFVANAFREKGIESYIDTVDRKNIMVKVDEATDSGVRYTCLVKRSHEIDGKTVSFRAVDDRGRSRGAVFTHSLTTADADC